MPHSNTLVGSWDYMQQLVHRMAMDYGFQSDIVLRVEKYIKKIEKHINVYESVDNSSCYHFVFDIFLAICKGDLPTFKGDKHCKAILAAVILYFDTSLCKLNEVDKREVLRLSQNIL